MKKIYAFLTFLLVQITFAQANDTFLAPPGDRLNDHGWTIQIGLPGELRIEEGSIPYPGIPEEGNKTRIFAGNTEGDNLPLIGLQGIAYYSAVINVLNTEGLFPSTGLGDFPIGMGATQGPNVNVNAISAELFVRVGSVAETFQLGIINNRGGVVSPTYSTENFPVNVPVFIVVKYVWSNSSAANTASLFINPVIGGAEGTPTLVNSTGTSAGPFRVASFVLRNGGTASAGTGNIEFDDINIGGTYEIVNRSFLGLKSNEINGLRIYPNPVRNGKLYISSDKDGPTFAEVYDLLGKKVLSVIAVDGILDISKLSRGVYVANITEAGVATIKKIVVE